MQALLQLVEQVLLEPEELACTPLKVTVLVPWVAPKLFPAMVTTAPIIPEAGEMLVIIGWASAFTTDKVAEPQRDPVQEVIAVEPTESP